MTSKIHKIPIRPKETLDLYHGTQKFVHFTPIHVFFLYGRPIFILPHTVTQNDPSLLQPSTSGTPKKNRTDVTQTMFYCLFAPYYSSITPGCVGLVSDVHTHLLVSTWPPPNVYHVVTWPPVTCWHVPIFLLSGFSSPPFFKFVGPSSSATQRRPGYHLPPNVTHELTHELWFEICPLLWHQCHPQLHQPFVQKQTDQ
jgi:hypothetical protein